MARPGKKLIVAAMTPLASLTAACSGWLWRCFCLAWARARLGCGAVPLDNQILGLIDLAGTCRIRMGRNCRIYKHVRLETQDDGEIIIGDNVVLSPGTIIVAHDRITLGAYVMVGEYTSIRDQDHRTDVPGPTRESGYVTAPVRIGPDAWLGRGCVVLKGVSIGDRAVIGANSVVTRDVPADEVWFGAPARARGHRGSGGGRPDAVRDRAAGRS